MKKLLLLLFGLLLLIGLYGCDDVTDCIINTRPHLPHTNFDDGQVGFYYEDIIRSEIRNEPRDDRYWYYYSVRGLPAGLDYEFVGQDLIIFGIPESPGRYEINVFLEVEARILFFDDNDGWDEDGDSLCSYTDERNFLLLVTD